MCCVARCRLGVECGAKCVDLCVLSKVEVDFSMRVGRVGVLFAEWYLCLDRICGY